MHITRKSISTTAKARDKTEHASLYVFPKMFK